MLETPPFGIEVELLLHDDFRCDGLLVSEARQKIAFSLEGALLLGSGLFSPGVVEVTGHGELVTLANCCSAPATIVSTSMTTDAGTTRDQAERLLPLENLTCIGVDVLDWPLESGSKLFLRITGGIRDVARSDDVRVHEPMRPGSREVSLVRRDTEQDGVVVGTVGPVAVLTDGEEAHLGGAPDPFT